MTTKRVIKACDACRKRKIKCNGEKPCAKCIKGLIECIYTCTAKKNTDKSKTRVSNKQIISLLTDKLQNIEALLYNATEANGRASNSSHPDHTNINNSCKSIGDIDTTSKTTTDSATNSSLKTNPDIRNDNVNATVTINATSISNNSPVPLSNNILSPSMEIRGQPGAKIIDKIATTFKKELKNELTSKTKIKNTDGFFLYYNGNTNKDYLGGRSSFSIFNRHGILWLQKKVPTKECTKILNNMVALNSLLKKDNQMYIEKVFQRVEPSLDVKPPSLFLDLICDIICNNIWYTLYILSKDKLFELINKYKTDYDQMDTTHLFLINTIFLCGCSLIRCYYHNSHTLLDELDVWENIFLINSVNYYQKFSLNYTDSSVKDPKSCVQAMLYFSHYMENSPAPQVCFMIVSSAVAICHQIGIYDSNYIDNISDLEERLNCRIIWWNCYRIDKYLSLRVGKPELIAQNEAKGLEEKLLLDITAYIKPDLFEQTKGNYSLVLENLKLSIDGLDILLYDYKLQLSKISSKCFVDLFSAKAAESTSFLKIESKILGLNEKLNEWCDTIPNFMRPELRNYSEIKNKLKLLKKGKPLKLYAYNAGTTTTTTNHNNSKNDNIRVPETDIDPQVYIDKLYLRVLYLLLEYHLISMSINRIAIKSSWAFHLNDNERLLNEDVYVSKIFHNATCILEIIQLVLVDDWNPMLSNELLFTYFSAFVIVFGSGLSVPEYIQQTIKPLIQSVKCFLKPIKEHRIVDVLKWSAFGCHILFFMKLFFFKFEEYINTIKENKDVYNEIDDECKEILKNGYDYYFHDDLRIVYNGVTKHSKLILKNFDESKQRRNKEGKSKKANNNTLGDRMKGRGSIIGSRDNRINSTISGTTHSFNDNGDAKTENNTNKADGNMSSTALDSNELTPGFLSALQDIITGAFENDEAGINKTGETNIANDIAGSFSNGDGFGDGNIIAFPINHARINPNSFNSSKSTVTSNAASTENKNNGLDGINGTSVSSDISTAANNIFHMNDNNLFISRTADVYMDDIFGGTNSITNLDFLDDEIFEWAFNNSLKK
ncbi:uncharacterized protein SCODWIG_01228 [Saccharomycodes ludwigii]|uniref:Zn(2)-C6 fungal-type domain-containing protein n=1 Tax=Saccharomycodes ludwigii TaxID=36035 RepID=A0A376B466_9ASCO|nr:uncharacterized protein SCODWIG_01228 [Saccharomycodes ludwigii]